MAHSTATRAPFRQGRLSPKSSRGGGLLGIFDLWRQRRALASLPPHLRRDVGLLDHEIDQEAARLMWDVPNNWRY